MKNLLPLLFFSCLLIIACQKEKTQDFNQKQKTITREISQVSPFTHPTSAVGTRVEFHLSNNWICLANEDDFANLLWSLQNEDLDLWEQKIQFTSYRKSKQLETNAMHYEIASVLNPDGIIQIGPWLIKLDFQNEKVLVIPSKLQEASDALNFFNSAHPEVLIFDFQDDIWTALQHSNNTEKGICKEERSKNKYVSTTSQSCTCTLYNWQNTTIALKYNRFGVWETVKAFYYNNLYDVYGQSNNHYVPAQLNSGYFQYYFDERCGYIYSGLTNIIPGAYDRQTFVLRSSKTPLERYKSSVNMVVNTSYIVNPSEPAQQLNCLLDQF